jgi:hypothetical protein
MSIEQTNDFHVCRRLARILAPEFRLFASAKVPEHSCVIDLKRKTIEVGESQDIFAAIPALLFQLGHLRLKDQAEYALFNGQGVMEWEGSTEALIEKISRQGVKADAEAMTWAASIFRSYWPSRDDITETLRSYMQTRAQWREYFTPR